MDSNVKHTREELDLVFNLWPENFLGLYDMGFRAFERLFNLRPAILGYMGFTPTDDWRKSDRMKRIVLSLEQTLVKAMATYADPQPDHTPDDFSNHMQEIGGMHRAIVAHIHPDNFELLFKLLPEVIADVTSARRDPPLTGQDRATYVAVWNSICVVMAKHFIVGWERRVVPTTPKFRNIYRSEKGLSSGSGSRSSAEQPVRGRTVSDATGSSSSSSTRRTPSRHGPHRSSTQVEMNASGSSSSPSNSYWLERGNSAPIALHDLSLEFQELLPS